MRCHERHTFQVQQQVNHFLTVELMVHGLAECRERIFRQVAGDDQHDRMAVTFRRYIHCPISPARFGSATVAAGFCSSFKKASRSIVRKL